MKELEPGTALTVRTALAIKKPAVLVHLGLTVPVGEVVVLLLKDSKLAPVLLLTVMLSLDVYLTPHALPPTLSLSPKPAQVQEP